MYTATNTSRQPQSSNFLLKETDQGHEIIVCLPGVSPEHIDIELFNQTLHVRTLPESIEYAQYQSLLCEFKDSEFHQSFTLSDDLDLDRLEARCADGYLRITLPLKQKAEPRRIPIKEQTQ